MARLALKKPLVVPPIGTTTPKQVSRGFSFRFYPNQLQQLYLAKAFGSSRFVYNKLLEATTAAYTNYKAGNSTEKPQVNNTSLSKQLTQLKQHPDHQWLYEASSTVLQESCFNLATAYQNFFRKSAKFPKFRSKHHKQSIVYTISGFSLEGKYLRLAKLDSSIKLKLSRCLPSQPTRCTITKTPSGEYYASLLCAFTPSRQAGSGTIGIDAGITDLATFSDGTSVPNPRHYLKSQSRLARYQHKLSKSKKGSKNREKLRIRVARTHTKIAHQRSDYLHKLSTRLVAHNQAIAIESLKVSNMLKNHKLAKHIADAGWGMFRQMLAYKVEETSTGYLFLADPYFPSTQLCSTCGTKPQEKLKLGTREWTCSHCGDTHQRDHNAAKNLEALAKAMLEQCHQGVYTGQIHLAPSYDRVVH